jgi:rare lipoprotein A
LALQLDWMAPMLAIFTEASLHRLQAGPYATRADASQAAERARFALASNAVVVERK